MGVLRAGSVWSRLFVAALAVVAVPAMAGQPQSQSPTAAKPTERPRPCGADPDAKPEEIIPACDARLAAGQFDKGKNEPFSLLTTRGHSRWRIGNLQGALDDASAAIREQPTHPTGHLLKGLINHAMGRFEQALTNYDEALKLRPDDPYTLEVGIEALLGLKRFADAKRLADEFVQKRPQHGGANNLACWSRALLGSELDKARSYCDAALRLEPTNASFLDSRAMVALKQGRFADSWADFDAAVRAKPNHAPFLYGRGVAAHRLGRATESASDIAAALRIDPAIKQTYVDYGVPGPQK